MQRGEKALAASGDAETCAPSQHTPEGRDASGDQWVLAYGITALSRVLSLCTTHVQVVSVGGISKIPTISQGRACQPSGVGRKLNSRAHLQLTHSVTNRFPFLGSAQKGIDSCWGRTDPNNITYGIILFSPFLRGCSGLDSVLCCSS